MALISPTNIIMGFYVHPGYELLPRWWNKSWLTQRQGPTQVSTLSWM